MRYAGEKRFNVWTALTLILLALFLLFVIYPIGMLIVKSLFVGGKVDLSYFVKFFSKKYYWVTLVNSFKVTVLSTLLASLNACWQTASARLCFIVIPTSIRKRNMR